MTIFAGRRSLPLSLVVLLNVVVYAEYVSGSRDLNVKPSGESFTRATGTSIVFTCEVMGVKGDEPVPDFGLKWFHNNTEIGKMARVYVEDDSPKEQKLYITEIKDEDEGEYYCIADIDGRQRKKSFMFLLFKEIMFDYAPEVQHPAINTDAIIQCRVSGNPAPVLSWRYKGVRVQIGGRFEIVADGLRIRNITLDDDGNYMCRAEVESEGRYSEQRITVAVHIPPSITEGPGISEGIDGEDLYFSCKADGLPPPEFEYYKDGSSSPLVPTERVKIDPKTGNISFKPLKKEDEGKYTCLAHNDVGNRTLDGEIIVNVKPSIYEFQSVSMKEGERLNITCASHGDPAPNMTIQKVGSSETYEISSPNDSDDRRIYLSAPEPRQASLTFRSLVIQDSGDYICKVENKFGSDEKQAKLTVTYRPRFADDHPKSVYIWAGKKRNITCDVLAEPVPTMAWLRGETNITNNGTFHTFTESRKSNLQVEVMETDQTWIYGHYKCQATNEWGTSEIDIELIRATPPDSPQSVNVSECFPNGVVFVVEPPLLDGGEKVRGYSVEYFEKPVETNVSIVGDGVDQGTEYKQIPKTVEVNDTKRIDIESLQPNTTYVFRVKARNDVGVGMPRELTVTTEAVRKPSPIQITSDRNADAFSYTITWKKPITGGRPIEKYEIRYREVKKDESGGQAAWSKYTVDDLKMPMLSYELVNLRPQTTYDLQVLAKNAEGWSDSGAVFQFQTREATPSEVARMQAASVGPGAIVGIVVVIFIVLLVVVDISCYFVNNCGVTMCICVHLCGKSATFSKEKAMEEGESKEVLKQPIETYHTEEGAPDGAGEPPVPAYTEQCLKAEDDKETKKEKEKLTEVLKEGMDGQKEEMESAEVATGVNSDADKLEKAPIV